MAVKSPYEIIRKPVLTERASILAEAKTGAQYVFEVAVSANKIEVAKAIETIYGVKVTAVNTILVKGKLKRQGRTEGHKSNWKKAFVSLVPGQKIEIG